jgi:hypothetical protein
MLEDTPADAERLRALETALDDMRSQAAASKQVLDDILSRLSEKPPTQSTATDTRRPDSRHTDPPLPPVLPAGRKKLSLKPSIPSDFDGDRTKGKAFLTSCRTYIRLCPESFDSELTQIVWAMSYMKSGRASRWAAREFEIEASRGRSRFIDWSDFETEFRKDFTPLNAEVAAVNTLETTSYFQGRRSVDDYLDQFRDLIYDSGYTDPKTTVVKFRRGLDRRISSALAGMTSGRPSDTDPESWYRLAVQMDQNRAADEAFHSSNRTAPTIPHSSRPSIIPFAKVSPAAPPARFAHAAPSPGNPVPMDIDAARKGKTPADACRRCGNTGHWAKDCHLRFDVRFMSTDELETAVENYLASKDVAPVEQLEEETEETPAVVEGFVSRSE